MSVYTGGCYPQIDQSKYGTLITSKTILVRVDGDLQKDILESPLVKCITKNLGIPLEKIKNVTWDMEYETVSGSACYPYQVYDHKLHEYVETCDMRSYSAVVAYDPREGLDPLKESYRGKYYDIYITGQREEFSQAGEDATFLIFSCPSCYSK
jgi:hypothetical protein